MGRKRQKKGSQTHLMMNVLVIGSGGREHALAWKIAQSNKIAKLYCIPGNAGIEQIAQCAAVDYNDFDAVIDFVKSNQIDLTVVGPEGPLCNGIVDAFQKERLNIFGPTKAAAQLEKSKIFAKQFMQQHNIPSARFKIFDNPDQAFEHIENTSFPVVIKADGLCAGKGVHICPNSNEAKETLHAIMIEKQFGQAGASVVIEEFLDGEEASILVLTDGEHYHCLASSQDHKRAYDNDKGPNTGGMGAYSPAPVVEGLEPVIESRIIEPLLKGMQNEQKPFSGILYLGLMIQERNPFVLEFNVRFGDPETQAILPRLQTDIIELFEATLSSKINELDLTWRPEPCVCVVVASGGYPLHYKKGIPINGLPDLEHLKNIVAFHAGTKQNGEHIETAGGRVLGITACGQTIAAAQQQCYEAISKIHFKDMHYRKDIGNKALSHYSPL
jgi:phosphoribosylamine---glycine ligase